MHALVILVVALVLGLGACSRPAPPYAGAKAGVVSIAAASDLKFAMDDLLAKFRPLHPSADVRIVYGSSGNFFAELSNRAPFDVFFSADASYPDRLIEKGMAVKDSKFAYGRGRIVIWVPAASTIDLADLGMKSLALAEVRRVAIANPAHAPYGRAAEAAMKSLGVYDAAKPKLVLGENVAQAAQFIDSGAADIGVIALSLALAPTMKPRGRYWEIPESAYPPLDQAAVILAWARDADLANSLRSFVLAPEGRAELERYGFVAPR